MRAENSIKPIIPVGKQVNTCMILEVTIARKCCLKGPDWELALHWSFEQFTFTFFLEVRRGGERNYASLFIEKS